MPEPKKETVRIVLPARRDGGPVTSNPRETAMISLPPKPVLVPPPNASSAPLMPAPIAPSAIGVPAIPRPPSIPAVPRPPVAPAAMQPPSTVFRPPSATPAFSAPAATALITPPSSPAAIKPPASPAPASVLRPPTMPPAAPSAPAAPQPTMPASATTPVTPIPPKPATSPLVVPVPLSTDLKKETAKVPPSSNVAKVVPQATVQFTKPASASISTGTALRTAPKPATEAATGELHPAIGIAAVLVALAALAVQALTFFS